MPSHTVKGSLEIYLRQIDASALLTAEQERELCWKIIHENCPLARERMIRSNLRLVVNIAKRFSNRGLPLTDLIEEGNLGLMRAVEAFDPDQGARFSTYASWWIKQSIKRALINAVQPVHIPAYMVELIAKWKRRSRELEEQFGRPATNHELAESLELPPRKARMVRKALRAFQRPAQTDSHDEESLPLAEMIHDEKTLPPDEQVFQSDDMSTIRKLMQSIDHREATILRLRYGLDGEEPLTLKEIGKHVGLTRERVRQLEIEALQKLHERLTSDRPLTGLKTEGKRKRGQRRKYQRPGQEKSSVAADSTESPEIEPILVGEVEEADDIDINVGEERQAV
ncbi:MAG: sigma-70 family RNA polymerase sigma factor [Phycisphaeraceae bacterium]|nr:sigma-70 family RNA polymerase sigma factor [Phycisphaeraceae bacterium]